MTNKKRFLIVLTVALVFLIVTLNSDYDEVVLEGWNPVDSRNTSHYISPNTSAIILPPKFCEEETLLVAMIQSAPLHFDKRAAIRDTWASQKSVSNSTISYYFLLGDTRNATLQEQILAESEAFGDIVQENFVDAYNNLTLKSVTLMKLASNFCSSTTKFVMKVDDDVFVNVEQLVGFLKEHRNSSNLLLGRKICKAQVIRNPSNKWYTPRYMFEGNTYPDYVSGTAYVVTVDAAEKLYEAALRTPIFHLEDVYLTGICAAKAKLATVGNYMFIYRQGKFDECLMRRGVTFHEFDAAELRSIYERLRLPVDPPDLCRKYKEDFYRGACKKPASHRHRPGGGS